MVKRRRTSEPRKFKTFLSSRVSLIAGSILVILFSVSLAKEMIRRIEVNREIAKLKQEVSDLEKQNAEITDLIQYFRTESFQEREARRKLGLAKPGEKVVIVPTLSGKEEESIENPEHGKDWSNPQRWWNYFFSSR